MVRIANNMNRYFLLHAFIVILLYENGFCSDWTSSILEAEEENSHHIPVFARKAGFQMRQPGIPAVALDNPTDVLKEEKKPKRNRHEDQKKVKPVSTEESDVIDLDDDEERDCGDTHFWHLRGRRCVPLQCPGGNAYRSPENGECILRRYKGRRRKKYSKYFSVPQTRVS